MNIKTCPLWQWILGIIGAFVLAVIGYGLCIWAQELSQSVTVGIVSALVLSGLYAVFVRIFEKEWAPDVFSTRAPGDLLLGILIGFLFFCVVVGVMCLAGCCRVEKLCFNAPAQIEAITLFLGVAVGEEILFRGVLFKWVDRRWGLAVALIVSSLVFGLIHITNDNATLWSSLAIAIEAGLLLGAAYKYSGTLWLPVGIHWAWNYTQGNIFGFAVSGQGAGDSFLKVVTSGPDLVTGGAFGAEASVISVVLGASIAALLVWLYVRKSRQA